MKQYLIGVNMHVPEGITQFSHHSFSVSIYKVVTSWNVSAVNCSEAFVLEKEIRELGPLPASFPWLPSLNIEGSKTMANSYTNSSFIRLHSSLKSNHFFLPSNL